MKSLRLSTWLSCVAVTAGFANPSAHAQCQDWAGGFELPGLNGPAYAMAVFNDGNDFGPALFVAGDFTTAGAVSANHIAKWDGFNWTAVGSGLNDVVYALATYDNGSGPLLYAGGAFTTAGGNAANRIANWNGVEWSAVGSGTDATVRALAVYSTRLYVGGDFTIAGGTSRSRVASTNGTSWFTLPRTGGNGTTGPVHSLAVFQSLLYIGGSFGMPSENIAVWNGTAVSGGSVGFGTNGLVRAMAVFTHPGGTSLYVGGDFTTAGAVLRPHIASFSGSGWSSLGAGTNGSVYSLAAFESFLYAGGAFLTADGLPAVQIGRWDGTAWSSVSSGTNGRVLSMATYEDGSGPRLFTGGLFTIAGSVGANHIAKFDGVNFAALGPGVNDGMLGAIHAFTQHDEGAGAGPKLFAGGEFTSAGGVPANRIAKWNGAAWTPLGSGADGRVTALASFDEGLGGGTELFAGGSFFNIGGTAAHTIAKWDGSNWFTVGNGLADGLYGEVRAFAVFDDGSGDALYAGGVFTTSGSTIVRRIAQWNGSTWSPLGSGTSGPVHALAVFDDGSGSALYAGGEFTVAGGNIVNCVAKWDGSSWSPLDTGTDGIVYALAVFDDGSGDALYAGGDFPMAGGVLVNSIAKWNGTSWSAVGLGMSFQVNALTVFDDGTGSGNALYAGGEFDATRGFLSNNIARWDGSTWSLLTSNGIHGTNAPVRALQVFDDQLGGGPDLYVGGDFSSAGGKLSSAIAQWNGCGGPGAGYCFGDNVDPIVTADCPCLNFGVVGHGCANPKASLGGARLDASGSIFPNTVKLVGSGIVNNAQTFFVEGTFNVSGGFTLGDGVSCVSGSLTTFGTQFAGHGRNAPNTASASVPAVPPGNARYYYAVYRTINTGFCPPELFNVSNAYQIIW